MSSLAGPVVALFYLIIGCELWRPQGPGSNGSPTRKTCNEFLNVIGLLEVSPGPQFRVKSSAFWSVSRVLTRV